MSSCGVILCRLICSSVHHVRVLLTKLVSIMCVLMQQKLHSQKPCEKRDRIVPTKIVRGKSPDTQPDRQA